MYIALLICLFVGLVVLLGATAKGESQDQAPRRQTSAKRRPVVLKFADLKVDAKRFSHRDDPKEQLDDLVRSIVEEGQLVPLTVWKDPATDVYYVVSGTRRYLAHKKAIEDNADRNLFRDDMDVVCVEVYDCDEVVDLQVISIADNNQRRDFSVTEKIKLAGECMQKGVPVARAYRALRVSETQFRRWLLIADNPWALELIEDDCLDASFTAILLETAKANDRLASVEEDIKDWVDETRLAIKRLVRRRTDAHKKTSDKEQMVKTYLTKEIRERWIECTKAGKRLDEEIGIKFAIDHDADKRTLTIPSLKADAKTKPEEVIKLIEVLHAGPAIAARFLKQIQVDHELKAGSIAAGSQTSDQLFEELGLGDMARAVKRQREQQEKEEAGEIDPNYDRREPREDKDVSGQIEDIPESEDHEPEHNPNAATSEKKKAGKRMKRKSGESDETEGNES